MIIKRLKASFGTLQNEELRLKEGLNIIEAPNEAGKSTWCAFLRAMFYGIDTADRDKTGYLSAKTRYRPWNGLPMEGQMDLIFGGKGITMQRRQQGGYPMRDFSAVYTGTSESIPQLGDKTAGETLLGVSEPIFERSAFIRQSGLPISQTAELEKRITSLVSTGEESISYSDVDAILREWLRKRRYNQRGLLPALESEARALREKLDKIEGINAKINEFRCEEERMKRFRDDFINESELIEKRERQEARKAYEAAVAEYDAAVKLSGDAEAELKAGGAIPTQEDIAGIRTMLEKLAACDALYASAQNRREAAKRSLDSIAALKSTSIFSPLTYEEAESKANRAAAAYVDAEELKNGAKAFSMKTVVLVALAVVMALLGAMTQLKYFGYGAAAVLAAVGVFIGVKNDRGFKQAIANAEKRSEILKEYKVSSVGEILAIAREYKELCLREDGASETFAAEDCELSAAKTALEETKEILLSMLKKLDPAAADVSRAPIILTKTEKLLDALKLSEMKRESAKMLVDRLAFDLGPEDPEEDEELPVAKYSRSEIMASIKYAEKQLAAINSGISMAQGELKTLGDPVIIRTRAAQMDERLLELNRQYDAIQLAIDTLSEANTEIQNRFAPQLSERAGRILAALTGGRYEKLYLDKKLSAEAEKAGESVGRDLLYLSKGTADQLYLAVRLAICELVLPQEEPCPIILDDALTNFDDERMKLALDFLKKTGDRRQILLFTCHSREGQYYDGVRDVNIIKVKG